MTTLAIILVLISATFHAMRDFFTKKAIDKQIFVWWYEIFAMIFFAPIVVYIVATDGLPSFEGVLVGIISGVIHFFYWMFLSKTYESGDLSHVYPIIRSSPAIVLVFSIAFLHETVTLIGVIGILIVVFGVYTINLKSLTLKSYLAPITSISTNKATQYAFLTMLTVAIYSLVDKIGVTYVNPLLFIYLLTVFAFTFYTPYIFKTKETKNIMGEWQENKGIIMIDGFLVISSYALILVAFTMSNLSYVVGLRQVSIIIAVLLGGQFLQEKNRKVRLFASLFIFIGAFMISVA